MEVYRYSNYRKLVNDLMVHKGRGSNRSALAKAAGCSPSWMTRALNGTVQITPDQALGIAQYFELNEVETEYFLFLVDFERAATPAMKKRIRSKLEALKTLGLGISPSVKTDSAVSEESSVKYYASWVYAAIHVACMIRPLSCDELALRLRVPATSAARVLRELEEMGLLTSQLGKWKATSKTVHIPAQHPMANVAHIGWRCCTTQRLQEQDSKGFHYSAIHCLSYADLSLIREKIKEAVIDCRKLIEPSTAETLAVFCMDWYEL